MNPLEAIEGIDARRGPVVFPDRLTPGAAYFGHGDATAVPLPDSSVDCVVTSPPYNVGMEYGKVSDTLPLAKYLSLIVGSLSEIDRVLKPGGRLWLNVPMTMPERSDGDSDRWSPAFLWLQELLAVRMGLEYRDTIAWHQDVADAATAWGSYLSPNAPNIRGRWEAVILAYKPGPEADAPWTRYRVGGVSDDLTAEDWPAWTQNVWSIRPAPRSWHPAPFPEELVRRCVALSTWPGEVVLDPFAGSFTAVRVAATMGRRAIGFDLNADFVRRAADIGVQQELA